MSISDLPLANGRKHQKVFEALGWTVRRDDNHIVMTKPESLGVTLSIPNHKEVRRETLKSIVRAAGLSDKEYRLHFDSI